MTEPKQTIKLNLGRLADAKSEFSLLASNVYFAVIREVEIKPGKNPGSGSFHWKLQVLDDNLVDTEGQPIKSAKTFVFHSYSAIPKPESNYNPDVFTRQIVEAVGQEAVDTWDQTGDLSSDAVINAVVKITVGLEGPREYIDKATGEKKTVNARNKIERFTRLSDEEAEQIQVPS